MKRNAAKGYLAAALERCSEKVALGFRIETAPVPSPLFMPLVVAADYFVADCSRSVAADFAA